MHEQALYGHGEAGAEYTSDSFAPPSCASPSPLLFYPLLKMSPHLTIKPSTIHRARIYAQLPKGIVQ
jgi:hypothetical protein